MIIKFLQTAIKERNANCFRYLTASFEDQIDPRDIARAPILNQVITLDWKDFARYLLRKKLDANKALSEIILDVKQYRAATKVFKFILNEFKPEITSTTVNEMFTRAIKYYSKTRAHSDLLDTQSIVPLEKVVKHFGEQISPQIVNQTLIDAGASANKVIIEYICAHLKNKITPMGLQKAVLNCDNISGIMRPSNILELIIDPFKNDAIFLNQVHDIAIQLSAREYTMSKLRFLGKHFPNHLSPETIKEMIKNAAKRMTFEWKFSDFTTFIQEIRPEAVNNNLINEIFVEIADTGDLSALDLIIKQYKQKISQDTAIQTFYSAHTKGYFGIAQRIWLDFLQKQQQ